MEYETFNNKTMKQTLSQYLKSIQTNERVKLPELDVASAKRWAEQILELYPIMTQEDKLKVKESADAYRRWKLGEY